MAKTDKRTFLFSIDWYEVLADYPEEVRLEVYEAIIRYASTGTYGELKPLAKMAFSFIRKEMDYNTRQYEEMVEKRRESGRKGGLMTQSHTAEETEASSSKIKQVEANLSKPKQTEASSSKIKQAQANPSHNDNDIDYDNNLKKEKIKKEKKKNFAENVTLTESEYARLCEEYTEDAVRRMIEILDNYKGQDGKQYKSDYRAILNWVVKRYEEENLRYGNRQYYADAQKSTGGTPAAPGHAAGTIQAATGPGPKSGDAPEKEYSERF